MLQFLCYFHLLTFYSLRYLQINKYFKLSLLEFISQNQLKPVSCWVELFRENYVQYIGHVERSNLPNVSFLKCSINVWFIYCIWVTGIFFTMLLSSKNRGSFLKNTMMSVDRKSSFHPNSPSRLTLLPQAIAWWHLKWKWKQMLSIPYLCFSYKIACFLLFCFSDVKMWRIFLNDKIKVKIESTCLQLICKISYTSIHY